MSEPDAAPVHHRAFLGLGSNIQPEENLPAAVQRLACYGTIVRVSNVWQSSPVGFSDQADFLNAAVLLETPLGWRDLKQETIPLIESELGRERDPDNKNGPRTIDIDLCIFDSLVLDSEEFSLPDPDIEERLFLALPLAEVDPNYVHPTLGKTLAEIASRLAARSAPLTARSDVELDALLSRS